ncbi:MAG TPA: Xaa-Pro peptidase family protein [Solirubrobacteraceae bacterium]|jgi:Xaa-Pro aminopeptidase|nr:Xaa-Pro peptidase family protein [Solirubrobacteraceae bacterium]
MSAAPEQRCEASRVASLAGELARLELDALLVDSLVNVRYLTGFTGSSAAVLVVGDGAREKLGSHRFLSDFRYAAQSAEQVLGLFEREIVTGELLGALAGTLAGVGGRLGFDDASLTVKQHQKLAELLGEAWELVPQTGAVERLREVKDAGEIARIRAATELADEALASILEEGLVGRTERAVAIELELRMRRLGAQAPSFPSIVAAGAHGALPHATPRDQEIPANVLVTIDWGALHEGYCSDCTRTYATGEAISAQAREVYALVLRAQREGLEAVTAGLSGREVDAVARAVIDASGHGEDFGHGLGHGVGMEVHEGPRLSRTAGEEPLRVGNVVTVEPGVYLPGVLGVRIEDLVVVREDAQEVLTSLPKELTVVS